LKNISKGAKDSVFNYLEILIALGKMGGARRLVTCTTSELGESVGISQQSTSRKLVEMENMKLIVRNYSQRGNSIKITPEGIANLEHVFTDLWMILTTSGREVTERLILRGKVITGMAEGAYYMGQKAYREQFAMLLDFIPFPGTLNLQILDEITLSNFERLLRLPAKFISGFKDGDRVFGKVFIWPIFILLNNEKIPAAIVRPERTHHTNQIEIISPDHIKEKYGVKDGDELQIVLE